MSYAAAAALQTALFQWLATAPSLAGVALYDALPPAALGTFVLLGCEEVRDAGDQSAAGALHQLQISIISDAPGFLQAKTLASAIADLLAGPPPALSRGRIVWLRFQRAQARRLDAGAIRRIDLRFTARIEI